MENPDTNQSEQNNSPNEIPQGDNGAVSEPTQPIALQGPNGSNPEAGPGDRFDTPGDPSSRPESNPSTTRNTTPPHTTPRTSPPPTTPPPQTTPPSKGEPTLPPTPNGY